MVLLERRELPLPPGWKEGAGQWVVLCCHLAVTVGNILTKARSSLQNFSTKEKDGNLSSATSLDTEVLELLPLCANFLQHISLFTVGFTVFPHKLLTVVIKLLLTKQLPCPCHCHPHSSQQPFIPVLELSKSQEPGFIPGSMGLQSNVFSIPFTRVLTTYKKHPPHTHTLCSMQGGLHGTGLVIWPRKPGCKQVPSLKQTTERGTPNLFPTFSDSCCWPYSGY